MVSLSFDAGAAKCAAASGDCQIGNVHLNECTVQNRTGRYGRPLLLLEGLISAIGQSPHSFRSLRMY